MVEVTIRYTIKGVDSFGNPDTHSDQVSTTTMGSGARVTGDHFTYASGLGAGASEKIFAHSTGLINCWRESSTEFRFSVRDLDTRNEQTRRSIVEEERNDSAERRALGTMIDNWNNEGRRKREAQEAKRKEEAARQEAEDRQRKERDRQLTLQRQMESARQEGERRSQEIRAWQARMEAEEQAERRRIQSEMAKGQAEREAYNREAEARAAQARAAFQAQQAAQQRAAQEEQARQAALARERAEQERRRQEQWRQQVNATTSLVQGSADRTARDLANAQQDLRGIQSSYSSEDQALADMIARAKAAAQAGK